VEIDERGNLTTSLDDDYRWNIKKRRFCYYAPRCESLAEAAERAGYVEVHKAVQRLMKDAPIRAAIEYELRACLRAETVNEETVIARWANWAEGNVLDYFEFIDIPMGEGDRVLRQIQVRDISTLPGSVQRRVKKLTVTNTQHGQTINLELEDRAKANDRLAQVVGLLQERSDDRTPKDSAESIRNAVAAMDAADSGQDPDAEMDGDAPTPGTGSTHREPGAIQGSRSRAT
jgi:phage terminase small subunit